MQADSAIEIGGDLLTPLVPRGLWPSAGASEIEVTSPWFFKSLPIPGDVCDFGSGRNEISLKFAFVLSALGVAKTVFAFDPFDDSSTDVLDDHGLARGAGSGAGSRFDELTKWSAVLPVRPIAGDPIETCKLLVNRLSFVWLSFGLAETMQAVLDVVSPLLRSDTIIGVNNVGGTTTPGVGPWVASAVAEGRLEPLDLYPRHFVGFYRLVGF